MHYLSQVVAGVDKTHPGLGRPIALAMVCIKAKKFLLLIAPRGCGKSRIAYYLAEQHPKVIMPDTSSMAGMVGFAKVLSNFDGVVILEDLSKAQTIYALTSTVASMAELCYGHRIERYMIGSTFIIDNFRGSVIGCLQPVLLKPVIKSRLWEASVQDKSLRYYHLYRPIKPNPMPPNVKLQWGVDFNEVETPTLKGILAEELLDIAICQWGWSRCYEHISDLLRACAALDRRGRVTQSDYYILRRLIQPLRLEVECVTKEEFESKRELKSNFLAILTEFASYGSFTLQHLSRDYKLSEDRCYKIMEDYSNDWVIVGKNPTTYAPSPELRERLKRIGLT